MSTMTSKQRNRQKQQKQFSQPSHGVYQEFSQLKKGKSAAKNLFTQKTSTSSVRYSKEIDVQEANVKQSKRAMTVFQSLFGTKDGRPVADFKAPVVDTNSFHSKVWHDFVIDEDALMEGFPHEGTYCLPFGQQRELVAGK